MKLCSLLQPLSLQQLWHRWSAKGVDLLRSQDKCPCSLVTRIDGEDIAALCIGCAPNYPDPIISPWEDELRGFRRVIFFLSPLPFWRFCPSPFYTGKLWTTKPKWLSSAFRSCTWPPSNWPWQEIRRQAILWDFCLSINSSVPFTWEFSHSMHSRSLTLGPYLLKRHDPFIPRYPLQSYNMVN